MTDGVERETDDENNVDYNIDGFEKDETIEIINSNFNIDAIAVIGFAVSFIIQEAIIVVIHDNFSLVISQTAQSHQVVRAMVKAVISEIIHLDGAVVNMVAQNRDLGQIVQD